MFKVVAGGPDDGTVLLSDMEPGDVGEVVADPEAEGVVGHVVACLYGPEKYDGDDEVVVSDLTGSEYWRPNDKLACRCRVRLFPAGTELRLVVEGGG